MVQSTYLQTFTQNGSKYSIRPMAAGDRDRVLSFAQDLPERDLAFMRRDISRPEEVDAWIQDLQSDRALSLLVEQEERIAAYGTLYYNQFFWNRHLAEVRIMVGTDFRRRNIGSRLVKALMGFAEKFEMDKVLSYMSVEDIGARRMFERLGFKSEAVLQSWIKLSDGRTHDLLIMSTSLRGMD